MLWFGDVIILLLTGALTGAALFQTWPDILPTNWETLLAGLLALIGAALTVKKMDEQIHTQQQLNKEKNDREAEKLKYYARAKFLMHTNLFLDNTAEIKKYILAIYKSKRGSALPPFPEPVNFDEILDPNLILPNDETSEKIQEILSLLQIVYARLPQLHLNKVIGEPQGSLKSVFQIEWLYLQILRDARSCAPNSSTNPEFLEHIIEKVNFQLTAGLTEKEKETAHSVCKAYLDGHAKGNVIKI